MRKLETEEGGGFVKKADGAHDLVSVQFHELDIAERESVRKFADFLRREHPEGIDIVVNNAGVAMTGFGKCILFCGPFWERQAITTRLACPASWSFLTAFLIPQILLFTAVNRWLSHYKQTPPSLLKPFAATTMAP